MKYMGSKAKYAAEILDAIEKEVHSKIYNYHNYSEQSRKTGNLQINIPKKITDWQKKIQKKLGKQYRLI